MQFSEALERVGEIYVPGVREFYGRSKKDPWQASHDRLEGVMILYKDSPDYFEKIEAASDEFVKEITKLIETYKVLHPGGEPKKVSLSTALHIGDEEKIKMLQSLTDEYCVLCEKKENIRAISLEKYGAGLFCINCVPLE
jgi:hypothetical protein